MTLAAGLLIYLAGVLTIPIILVVVALKLGVTWAEFEEEPMLLESAAAGRVVAFVGRRWKALALAGLVAIAGVQSWRVHRLKADVVTAQGEARDAEAAARDPVTRRPWAELAADRQRDLTQCQTNRAALQNQLDGQNLEIDRLGAAGEARIAAADQAAANARAGQRAAEARARDISRIPTSASCPEVDAIFEEAFR